MDRIRVKGGARLKGEIPISGAKNAALPLMAAALLTDEKLTLLNAPWLADIAFMADLLRSFGVETSYVRGPGFGEGGSALKHNKAFFFISIEKPHTITPTDPVTVTVPTALERIGNFSQSKNSSGATPVGRASGGRSRAAGGRRRTGRGRR